MEVFENFKDLFFDVWDKNPLKGNDFHDIYDS